VAAFAERDVFDVARDLVQRVQTDLTAVRDTGTHKGKDRERLDTALKHLSDLDRTLTKDKFSKGRLDEAIEDVQHVIDHNTLESRDRDTLLADVRTLRELRLAHER
jgi:hypothetical protein